MMNTYLILIYKCIIYYYLMGIIPLPTYYNTTAIHKLYRNIIIIL